jgi:PKD repeat protein
MKKILFSIFLFPSIQVFSQCFTDVSFSLNDTVCNIDEIVILNNSTNFSSYEWDFFPGDLSSNINLPLHKFLGSDSITDIRGSSFAIDPLSGEKFAFIVSNTPKRILSYQLNDSLNNFNTLYNFGNPGNFITSIPASLRFNKEIGFLANTSSNQIIQYFFNSGFNNPPDSVRVLNSTPALEYRNPTNLRLFSENNTQYLLVSNTNSAARELSILTFGSNPNSIPTLVQKVNLLNTVNNTNSLVDFDLIRTCNKILLYGLLDNGALVIFDFGNSLVNVPTKILIPQIAVAGTKTGCKVEMDEMGVHVFILTSANQLSHYLFDKTGLLYQNQINTYSNIFGVATADTRSFDILKFQSGVFVIGGNRSGNITARGVRLGNFLNASLDSTSIDTNFIPIQIPFTTTGMHYISIKAKDTLGNEAFALDSVYVKESLSPHFTILSSCVDFPIAFNNTTQSNLLQNTWTWDFGDGTGSNLENPIHLYSSVGSYQITFEIEAANACEFIYVDSIEVFDIKPELPNFTFSPTIVCENTALSFLNTSSTIQDSIVSFSWDFGDGNLSNLENPTHQFTNQGSYLVTLTLKGKYDCDTTIAQTINVQPGPSPDFQVSDLCINSPSNFTDVSSAIAPSVINKWFWDWGNGDTSTLANPSYTYLLANTFQVSLTVETDSGCIATITKPVTIEPLPIVNFSHEIACAQGEVSFYDESNGNISAREWKFPDNITEIDSLVSYVFSNEGLAQVQLIVSNSNGCIDSLTKSIEIFPALLPDFTFENICIGDSIQFTNETESFSVIQRTWDFGFLNQSSNLENPTFYYPSVDTYMVRLSLVNAIGCENSIEKPVSIKNLPLAAASFENLCEGSESFLFDNSSFDNTNLLSNSWLIEGETYTGDTLSYVFDQAGTYTVVYEIIDNNACENSTTFPITIETLPLVDFSFSPNYGTAPLLVEFSNLSSNANAFSWIFDDLGSSSNDPNPNFTYLENGNYTITLYATNTALCSDSLKKNIAVIPTELDVEISNLLLEKTILNNGVLAYKASVLVKNVGSRNIDNMDLLINLNSENQFAEYWEGTLGIGQAFLYEFTSFLYINNEDILDYICVEASNVNDNTELVLTNNVVCEIQKGLIQSSSLYPNPASDQVNLDLILASNGLIKVSIVDMKGSTVLDWNEIAGKKGYNKLVFNTKNLLSGCYFVQVIHQDEMYTFPLTLTNK